MTPQALAALLEQRVRQAGVLDLERLGSDTAVELARDSSVEVGLLDPRMASDACSIVATHQERPGLPCRILLAPGQSRGRTAFSLLHEYGHHLLEQVVDAQMLLFQAGASARSLEERMCDTFASRVLLPVAVLDDAFAGGVTAAAVADLIESSAASSEAVAVAAANRLDAAGYVILLRNDASVAFAARGLDAPHLARGTAQDGLLQQAAAGLRMRGTGRVTYRTGTRSPEHHIDAAHTARGVIAVAVTERPAWLPFTPPVDRRVETTTAWCETCEREFSAFAAPCGSCGEPPCPVCRACGCGVAIARGSRQCSSCFQVQGARAFADDSDSVCILCAG